MLLTTAFALRVAQGNSVVCQDIPHGPLGIIAPPTNLGDLGSMHMLEATQRKQERECAKTKCREG